MSLLRTQLVAALVLALAGCGGRVVTTANSSADDKAKEQKSDDVLTSALYQLHPDIFGINATTDKPVSLLNSWRFKQIEQRGTSDEPTPVDVPAEWISDDEQKRLVQSKFDIDDAIHIRDSLLFHMIAGYLSDRGRDEIQRVKIIVDFVCRNISLWKDDELEIPLPTFYAATLGRGSADDRAWVCAEILRQLRIDTVVLRSKKDTKESTEKWLLGAIVDKQVYLFDMRLGLPIPNGAMEKESPVATLADLATHPQIFDQMSAVEPYRLAVDDIRDASVSVIGDVNFWAARMQRLEQSLPASDICVLYDPLTGHDRHPGLLQRVASAGGWSAESLKLWQYPRKQIAESKNASKEMAEEFQRLLSPLTVPIPVKTTKDGKQAYGAPERKLQRFRLDQLLGKFSDATKRYLSIRHLEVERNPPDLELLNRLAAEDAFYWTSLCKFELGEYDAAIEQLLAYVKKYDRKGKWFFPARALLARCYAETGKLPEALSTLERTSSDDPYRLSNAIQVKSWNAARTK